MNTKIWLTSSIKTESTKHGTLPEADYDFELRFSRGEFSFCSGFRSGSNGGKSDCISIKGDSIEKALEVIRHVPSFAVMETASLIIRMFAMHKSLWGALPTEKE